MKKVAMFLSIALIGITLVGCSSNSSQSSKPEGSANNRKIAKSLKSEINSDGKVGTVKVETEVTDEQSVDNKPHEVVSVVVTDKTVKDELKADEDALDAGTATTDQSMYVAGMQDIISKAAKKLDNNKDTVEMKYEIDSDNFRAVALSMKDKDIIAPVTIK